MFSKSSRYRRVDGLPDDFRDIMSTVSRELGEYSDVSQQHTQHLNVEQQAKFNQKLEKIEKQLMISERHIMDRTKTADDLRTWIDGLNVIKRTFDAINKQDAVGQNDFILKFARNTNQLKSLQTDVVALLRRAIHDQETPDAIRLERTVEMKRKEFDHRCQVYDQIKGQVTDIDTQLEKVCSENAALVQENEEADAQLRNFTSSNSYEVIQKARKKKIMTEEWKARKARLEQQIATTTAAYESFRDAEKAAAELGRQDAAQEAAMKKMEAQYTEDLRMVSAEAAISERNNKSMMSQLEKDLVQQRTRALQSEKTQTNRELQASKAQADRELAKIRNDKMAKLRDVERLLKRATNVMKPQDFLDTISNFYKADRERLSVNLETIVGGLRELVERHKTTLGSSTQLEIDRITKLNEMQKEILKTSKVRISQRMSERQLELMSITDMLVTVNGIVEDIQKECDVAEATNKENERNFNLAVESRDASVAALRKEIESADLFITKASTMVAALSETMNQIIENVNNRQVTGMVSVESDKEEQEHASDGGTSHEQNTQEKPGFVSGECSQIEPVLEEKAGSKDTISEGNVQLNRQAVETVDAEKRNVAVDDTKTSNVETRNSMETEDSELATKEGETLYQMMNRGLDQPEDEHVSSTSQENRLVDVAVKERQKRVTEGKAQSHAPELSHKDAGSQKQATSQTESELSAAGIVSNISVNNETCSSQNVDITVKREQEQSASVLGTVKEADIRRNTAQRFDQDEMTNASQSDRAAHSDWSRAIPDAMRRKQRKQDVLDEGESLPSELVVDEHLIEENMTLEGTGRSSARVSFLDQEHENVRPTIREPTSEQRTQLERGVDELIRSKGRIKVTVKNRNAFRQGVREPLPFQERPTPKVPLLTFSTYKFKKPDPVKKVPNREPSFVSSGRAKTSPRVPKKVSEPPEEVSVVYERLDPHQKVDFRSRIIVNGGNYEVDAPEETDNSAIVCRKTICVTVDRAKCKPRVTRVRPVDEERGGDLSQLSSGRRPASSRSNGISDSVRSLITDQNSGNLISVTRF